MESIIHGLETYVREIPSTRGPVYLTYFNNLIVTGAKVAGPQSRHRLLISLILRHTGTTCLLRQERWGKTPVHRSDNTE